MNRTPNILTQILNRINTEFKVVNIDIDNSKHIIEIIAPRGLPNDIVIKIEKAFKLYFSKKDQSVKKLIAQQIQDLLLSHDAKYISRFDALEIQNSNWFIQIGILDDFGTAAYVDKSCSKNFTIFNTNSDINIKRHPHRLITPFIIYSDNICEIGDIYYDIVMNRYELENYRIFNLPKELQIFNPDTFSGMNGFLYYPKDNMITLKMDMFSMSKIPKDMITEDKRVILRISPEYMRKLKINDIND